MLLNCRLEGEFWGPTVDLLLDENIKERTHHINRPKTKQTEKKQHNIVNDQNMAIIWILSDLNAQSPSEANNLKHIENKKNPHPIS